MEPFLALQLLFFPRYFLFCLQLFSRMLQHCFAVKLEKCLFVDYNTSPDFTSAWREERMSGFFIFGRLVLFLLHGLAVFL